jgi:phage gp29-like protein
MAQSGNLRLAADLCDDILADDSIIGTLEKRTRGVIRLHLNFEAADGAKGRTPIIRASSADWYLANPEDEHAQLLAWGILLGVGLAELIWKERNGRVLPTLKIWHPRHLRWDDTARVWKLNTVDGEIPITPGDGKWLLFTPYGTRRPWARGKWRAVSSWFLLKRFAITDWARYGEKHGLGTLVGTLPEGKAGDKKARADLANELKAMGSNGVVVFPPGYDVKLLEATANTWATFKAQIETADAGIAVAILGQNLTTRVSSSGSRAAATVHETVEQNLIEADARTIETTHREQQWVWWTEFNYGNRDLTPWPNYQTATPAQISVDAYHLEYGLVTINEARAIIGLPELPGGGDRTPVPVSIREAQSADSGNPAVLPPTSISRRLASGAPINTAPGFVVGQLHADAIADHALEDGAPKLKRDAERVLAAVWNADDYDSLRDALLETFGELNPDDLEERMHQALVMADLTGRWAVRTDADS